MKFQSLWWSSGNLFDRMKLSNPDRVMNFLREAKELLGIEDSVPYVRGATPTPKNPNGEKFLVGGVVGLENTILIHTIPVKTELHLQVFYDDLSEEALKQVSNIAERLFRE